MNIHYATLWQMIFFLAMAFTSAKAALKADKTADGDGSLLSRSVDRYSSSWEKVEKIPDVAKRLEAEEKKVEDAALAHEKELVDTQNQIHRPEDELYYKRASLSDNDKRKIENEITLLNTKLTSLEEKEEAKQNLPTQASFQQPSILQMVQQEKFGGEEAIGPRVDVTFLPVGEKILAPPEQNFPKSLLQFKPVGE